MPSMEVKVWGSTEPDGLSLMHVAVGIAETGVALDGVASSFPCGAPWFLFVTLSLHDRLSFFLSLPKSKGFSQDGGLRRSNFL